MATEAAARHSAWSALWTFPSILASAFVIAWGAEGAQFLISQGLALAILAWLQTLPEFAVEASRCASPRRPKDDKRHGRPAPECR